MIDLVDEMKIAVEHFDNICTERPCGDCPLLILSKNSAYCMRDELKKKIEESHAKKTNGKYGIYVEYFFYSNVYGANEDGFMMYDGEPLSFSSYDDALLFLTNRVGNMYKVEDNVYMFDGKYLLSHGEYAAPKYSIIEM